MGCLPSLKDHVLLLLAIKPEDKLVDFDHILEKIGRDTDSSRREIITALSSLIDEGLVEKVGDRFRITVEGRKLAERFVNVEGLNRSYRLVLEARLYYPGISEYILPFLVNRPVSVIKVFSDDSNPLHKVKPIFNRYRRRKPRVYNYVRSGRELMSYVNMHVVDFIPYVHREGESHPDWFIIDIDAGDDIKNAGDVGFELVKEVTQIAVNVLVEKFGVHASVKFSGSRGFQIWAVFDGPLGSFEDYRKGVIVIQRYVEEEIKRIGYDNLKEKYGDIVGVPLTTSTVAKRGERRKQILFDWSSLKPEGDVRAPYSIHYKTGLISVPVNSLNVSDFVFEMANFRSVLRNIKVISSYFSLEKSSSIRLVEEIKSFGLLSLL